VAGRGEARLGTRKHRFVYCCVIAGACFDVTVLAWRKYATLLPPNSLTVCHLSFLLKFLPLITSSCKLFFHFSRRVHSPTTTSASPLRPARPEQFPNKFSVSPGYQNHPKFSSFLPVSQHNHPKCLSLSLSLSSGWGRCFYITGSCCICSFFFRFGGGLPLYKVHFFILRNTVEVPTSFFATFPLKISSDVSSILRRSCRLVSGFSILILP
jgi:hypothetical protein